MKTSGRNRKGPTPSARPSRPRNVTRIADRRSGRRMFDWNRLSKGANSKEFEDMCLDLFGESHGDVVLVPGPRRTGKDGGSDGAYDGRVGNRRAHWKIACAIRQKIEALQTKVDQERDAALNAGFTGLIVITSLDLTVDQVKRLEARAL